MRSKREMWIAAACLTSLLLLASCDTFGVHHRHNRHPGIGHGPPAHANAYGYRHKQVCGYDLVYDSGCGMYIVVGMTDWYYHEGYFYRLHGDVWQISVRADVWEPAGHDRLPAGLRIKTKPIASLTGHGNNPVKLNGNGNSLVKLNGNPGGHGKGKK